AFLCSKLHRTMLRYMVNEEEDRVTLAGLRQSQIIGSLLEKHRDDWSGGVETLAREASLDQLAILCSTEGDELLMRAAIVYLDRWLPRRFPQVDIRIVEDAIQRAMISCLMEAGRGKTIAYLCGPSELASPHRVLGFILKKAEWNVGEELRKRKAISLDRPDDDEDHGTEVVDPNPTVLEDLIKAAEASDKKEFLARTLRALRSSFDQLPPSYQCAILLIGLDFSRAEAADALIKNVGTFDTQLSRARDRFWFLLQRQLQADGIELPSRKEE